MSTCKLPSLRYFVAEQTTTTILGIKSKVKKCERHNVGLQSYSSDSCGCNVGVHSPLHGIIDVYWRKDNISDEDGEKGIEGLSGIKSL